MKSIFKRLLNVKDMVVEDVSLDDSPLRDAPVLVARVRCGKGALRCSRCGRKAPGYNNGGGGRGWRRQDFGCFRVELSGPVPRVECRLRGVVVSRVPWAEPGGRFTRDFESECAWLMTCVSTLLYIVKGFGVLVWLVRGGDGLDPEGGATFEFGQVAGAAFDLADAAGVDAEGVADLLLGDAVCDAQFTESSSAFGGRFADGRCSCADGDEGPVCLAGDEAFQAADDSASCLCLPWSSDSRSRGWAGGSACGRWRCGAGRSCPAGCRLC